MRRFLLSRLEDNSVNKWSEGAESRWWWEACYCICRAEELESYSILDTTCFLSPGCGTLLSGFSTYHVLGCHLKSKYCHAIYFFMFKKQFHYSFVQRPSACWALLNSVSGWGLRNVWGGGGSQNVTENINLTVKGIMKGFVISSSEIDLLKHLFT